MRRIIFRGLIWALLLSNLTARELGFQLTLKVVDDEGQPLPSVNVQVSFDNENARKPSERVNSVNSLTDLKGRAQLDGKTAGAEIGFGAHKDGYYFVSGSSYQFSEAGLFKWQPWNPTIEVVLKRIRNPVPMYAKREERKIPDFGKPIGYDLMKSDWVAPYGKGEVSDVIFEANRKVQSAREYDGTLALHFPNGGDGLIPLEVPQPDNGGLRMPYSAPEVGYLSTKTWQESRHTAEDGSIKLISSVSKTMNYFIRIRTVQDAQGNIVQALYGKIHGDIRWFIGTQAPKSGLAFTYYLNPDGTRNVEFDPKRNLLKSSKPYDPDYENLAP